MTVSQGVRDVIAVARTARDNGTPDDSVLDDVLNKLERLVGAQSATAKKTGNPHAQPYDVPLPLGI